ncbi:hypothetical protein [Amaricoccus sp.]|nr:hypothetical protein [uncultured Amaricoccus sp.]
MATSTTLTLLATAMTLLGFAGAALAQRAHRLAEQTAGKRAVRRTDT